MKLAIFDFDGTLFPHQSIPYLVNLYKKMGYKKTAYYMFMLKISWILLKYKLPFIKGYTQEKFRKKAVVYFMQMFNGKTFDELNQFYNSCIDHLMQDLNPLIVEELKKAQADGYYTILLSGCLKDVLQGIGDNLQMNYVIATEIKAHHADKLQFNDMEYDIIMGDRKVEKLLEVVKDKDVDWENSIAYGDSLYDESILRIVGKPVAVNPDIKLKTIAEMNSWTILQG